MSHQTFSSKTVFSLILEGFKKIPGINPMSLSAPWFVSYSKNCLESPNFHHQTFSPKIALKSVNKSMMTSVTTKPAPSPWPPTSLRWEGICMPSLVTVHRQFSITPKDKFQDQLTLIQLMRTNKSKINNFKIHNKTPKDNTLTLNVWRKTTQRSNLWK